MLAAVLLMNCARFWGPGASRRSMAASILNCTSRQRVQRNTNPIFLIWEPTQRIVKLYWRSSSSSRRIVFRKRSSFSEARSIRKVFPGPKTSGSCSTFRLRSIPRSTARRKQPSTSLAQRWRALDIARQAGCSRRQLVRLRL